MSFTHRLFIAAVALAAAGAAHAQAWPNKPIRVIVPFAAGSTTDIVAPAKNIKTLQELLAAAHAKPGSINFAPAGQGSATHLKAEKFKMAAKIEATNIPFKGSAEAVTEVISGRVDDYFSPIAPVIGQIKDGQLIALAVGSPKRAAALPDEVVKALASPEVKERSLKLGADPWTLSPAQFDAYIKEEIVSNARLVKAAGLQRTP